MTIYDEMKAAGVEMDSHESDLYVKNTPEAREIVAGYEYKSNVTGFTSQIDGAHWLDIPFAYDPWWTRAAETVATWAKGVSNGTA